MGKEVSEGHLTLKLTNISLAIEIVCRIDQIQSELVTKMKLANPLNIRQRQGILGLIFRNRSFLKNMLLFFSAGLAIANLKSELLAIPAGSSGYQSDILSSRVTSSDRKEKFGDGCYHVFLDVGSNVGVHGRFLFEPQKYPNAKEAHGIFNEHFGGPEIRDNRNICVFAFEPNPVHKERHLQLQEAYSKVGWRYHHFAAGAGDKVENVTFYHQDNGNNNEWGFSSSKREGGENIPVNVTSIRLSSWLREHIEGRMIPQAPSDAGSKNETKVESKRPTVVMKFDVEGYEYILLPDLMFTGAMCSNIDYAFGEVHPWIGAEIPPEEKTGKGGLYLRSKPEARKYWDDLLMAFRSLRSNDCRTKIEELDDESYLMDGMPLDPEIQK